MIFSCDKDKPDHTSCDDIPQSFTGPKDLVHYETTTSRNRYIPTEATTINPLDLKFDYSTNPQPWLLSSTPSYLTGKDALVCPEQCPRGPPGPPGPPGPRGLTGEPVSLYLYY